MNKQIFEYHPLIGYRYIPNLQTRIQHESGGYLLKTNDLGFRSEFQFSPKKSAGIKRVILFGDSYTSADGVSNKKRYSDILMQMMPGTEICNFGMPGTGTDQQYLIYKEFAKDIEHDAVMIVLQVENIRRIVAQYRYYYNDQKEKILHQKPYFELEKNQLQLKNVPVDPNLISSKDISDPDEYKVDEGGRFPRLRKIINKTNLRDLVLKLTKYQPLPEYKANTHAWILLKSILLKWFSEINKPILLVPLPMHHYVEEQCEYKNIEKRFNELKNTPNLKIFDPINQLKTYSMEERRKFRFEIDSHPSPYGHETYARILKPSLEELLLKA